MGYWNHHFVKKEIEGMSYDMAQVATLKDKVYQSVIDEICKGYLTPDTIFTEGQMIARYGVSKAPVREALVQLCHENVLRSIPRCGYQVVQISAKNVHDLIELRLLLEVGSLPKVMEYMDEETLRQFREMNEKRRVNAENRDMWTAWRNNEAYHIQLNAVARNAQVTQVLKNAMEACTRAYAQGYQSNRQHSLSGTNLHMHDKIIDALERGDLATAEDCLRQDIEGMERDLLDLSSYT